MSIWFVSALSTGRLGITSQGFAAAFSAVSLNLYDVSLTICGYTDRDLFPAPDRQRTQSSRGWIWTDLVRSLPTEPRLSSLPAPLPVPGLT
ncbi:hypothetical protein LY76DRAFT_586384 [Colletotrichum caudatum]|nr:hypothetical protein LY76DRAFT_586384 [Colletotrichum caudatum]